MSVVFVDIHRVFLWKWYRCSYVNVIIVIFIIYYDYYVYKRACSE